MTKLSKERLEEIRLKSRRPSYGYMEAEVLIDELLAHIDALEEENKLLTLIVETEPND